MDWDCEGRGVVPDIASVEDWIVDFETGEFVAIWVADGVGAAVVVGEIIAGGEFVRDGKFVRSALVAWDVVSIEGGGLCGGWVVIFIFGVGDVNNWWVGFVGGVGSGFFIGILTKGRG